MGHADQGNGLALETGGDVMWFLPFSITLAVRKTRTGWSMTVRATFIVQANGARGSRLAHHSKLLKVAPLYKQTGQRQPLEHATRLNAQYSQLANTLKNCIYVPSSAEAADAAPAGGSARTGHADPGKGLALELEVRLCGSCHLASR
jgi:hypothetical protein